MNKIILIISIIIYSFLGSSQSNYNNFIIGGSPTAEIHSFKKDSLNLFGAGIGFKFSYYPIDFNNFGIGVSFEPIYLNLYNLHTFGLRLNGSLKLFCKKNSFLPFGIEFKYGYQALSIKNQIFKKNIFEFNSYYKEIIINVPLNQDGQFFFGLNYFSIQKSNGIGFKIGFAQVIDFSLIKKPDEIFYYD